MFLVKNARCGMIDFVFTYENPQKHGCTLVVVEDASIDYDLGYVHSWPDGHDGPDVLIGQDPVDLKNYKVFRSKSEFAASGFIAIAGTAYVFGQWSEYADITKNDVVLNK